MASVLDLKFEDFFSSMYFQDFHRNRPVFHPMDRELIDFQQPKVALDWETPFQHNFHRKRIPLQDYTMRRTESGGELITLDKWYSRLSEPMRLPIRIIHAPDSHPNQTGDELITVDKFDNPLMRIMPKLTPRFVPPWPFTIPPDSTSELITLDKWHSRLPEPMRLISWRQPPIGVLDAEPIPDTALLPARIPWYTPLSYEFNQRTIQTPPMSVFVDDTGPEDVAQFVDKWGIRPIDLIPRPLILPIALHPYSPPIPDLNSENITLDKWHAPLAYNFHRRIPQTPLMGVLVPSGELENITLDKWYSNTGFWSWPYFALRAVTGPEGQRSDILRSTAPWIPLSRFDPLPIPDIPGVTGQYWFAPLSLPRQLFTSIDKNDPNFLRLYLPFQDFPIVSAAALECESPRRRPSEKTMIGCGSDFVR